MLRFFSAEEIRLERHHASTGEKQGWVIPWYERRAREDLVSLAFKELEEPPAQGLCADCGTELAVLHVFRRKGVRRFPPFSCMSLCCDGDSGFYSKITFNDTEP